MNNIALLPRALGALFFYPPSTEVVQQVKNNLLSLLDRDVWNDREQATQLVHSMNMNRSDATTYAHSVLFEGQDILVAPPWGSVYQELDNTLMGESTARYDQFLQRNGIKFEVYRQPQDHFGLMLWSLACLLEEGNEVSIVELLATHILPWSYRYLELLIEASEKESLFYFNLAKLTHLFLQNIESNMGISINKIQLFK